MADKPLNNLSEFRRRLIILLASFLIWGGLAAGALFYYSVYECERYLDLGNRLALRHGTFQAPRGRILDRNGVALAWSEKYFDLFMVRIPDEDDDANHLLNNVRLVIPDCEVQTIDEKTWLLKADLSPGQLLEIAPLLSRYPELKIQSRLERRTVVYPEIRRILGTVQREHDTFVGISGAELQYNKVLTGMPGSYAVMLDRRRRWIQGTWKLLKPATPGKDVKLDFAVSDRREL